MSDIKFEQRKTIEQVEESTELAPKFDQDGLIPVVTTDFDSGEVLMQGYMNKEAFKKTISLGEAVYYSRSRKILWHKGKTSGLVQKIKEIRIDDDQDCVWLRVDVQGGASCHVGYRSCFYRSIPFHAFTDEERSKDHISISMGDLLTADPVLCRIHSQCITGESFFSMRCDCRYQLTESLTQIAERRRGVIFYLQQEGRGIGLSNKIRAYNLQDKGLDTVEANHQLGFKEDERGYGIVSDMINFLGIKEVDLMTNNPKKIKALEAMGIVINQRVPLCSNTNKYNEKYISTKVKKLGHLI